MMTLLNDSTMTISNCMNKSCQINEAGRKLRIRDEQSSDEVGSIWDKLGKAGFVGSYEGIPYLVNPMMRQTFRDDGTPKTGRFMDVNGRWTSTEKLVWNVARMKARQIELKEHEARPNEVPAPSTYPEQRLVNRCFSPMHKALSDTYMLYSQRRKLVKHTTRAIEGVEVWDTNKVQYDSTYFIPLDHYDPEYDHRKSEGTTILCPCCGSEEVIFSSMKDKLEHECSVKFSPRLEGKTNYVTSLDGAVNKEYKVYVNTDTGVEYSEVEARSEKCKGMQWKKFNDLNQEVTGQIIPIMTKEESRQLSIYREFEDDIKNFSEYEVDEYNKLKHLEQSILIANTDINDYYTYICVSIEGVTEDEAQNWVTNFWEVELDGKMVPIYKLDEADLRVMLNKLEDDIAYGRVDDYDESNIIAHALRLRLDELGRKDLRAQSWNIRKELHRVEETDIDTYTEDVMDAIDEERALEILDNALGLEPELDDCAWAVSDDEWM